MGWEAIGQQTIGAAVIGACSDIGRVRRRNEDHFLVDRVVDNSGAFELTAPAQARAATGLLCAVADGLGGHAAGDRASRIALSTLRGVHSLAPPPTSMDEICAQLRRGIQQADTAIRNAAASQPQWRGMGTTMVGLVLGADHACGFNVGDSRLYRWHAGTFEQISIDHTVAAARERAGLLSHEEAEMVSERHVITNCVGGPLDPDMYVDCHPDLLLQAGTRFLLCSDGVSGAIERAALAMICASKREPVALARALIDEANRRGGVDNATAVVIEIR